MIEVFILFVISFFLGYYVGQGKATVESITSLAHEAKAKLNTRVGAVSRPTAQEVNRRGDKTRMETEQAMIDTLKGMPELNKKIYEAKA